MERLKAVTEEEWKLCNEYNRELTEEFLSNSPQLSDQTKRIYLSNLMIWFNWVREHNKNKAEYEIKSIEFMKYQNWLISKGHSSNDISNKRAAVSTINNYIVLFYQDDYPTFKNFIVKGMPRPEKQFVRPKEPPTKEEFENIVSTMEKREDWQKVAYLLYTYDTGCRRAESVQLLKEVVDYEPIVKEKTVTDEEGNHVVKTVKYYQSNKTRCKGRGKTGKVRKLSFTERTMDAIKKWLEVRGDDDCPYVFVSKRGGDGSVKQLSCAALNKWASTTFTAILGRPFTPHGIRRAKATISIVEDGRSIQSVQHLLGHESSSTTEIYVINDEDEDIDELFVE